MFTEFEFCKQFDIEIFLFKVNEWCIQNGIIGSVLLEQRLKLATRPLFNT